MTPIKALILGAATLSIAACSSPDRFDNEVDLSATRADQAPVAVAPTGPASNSPEYFQQTVGDRVLFLVDQSTLTSAAMGVLDGQANWLKTNSDYVAIIEGHADEQGTREYNLALGARRSNAVKEYLVSKGISNSRLRVLSYGKERPIEICSQEGCYAQNRRAVTIISGGLTS